MLLPNPEILLQPNVPKPLHGLNPRTVMGQKWWDEQRQAAYAKFDQRCWACGVHKSNAKLKQWLEAHEVYHYDYGRGRAWLTDIVALCRPCHNFIHNGREVMILMSGESTWSKYLLVMRHGWNIIKENGLSQNPFALHSWKVATDWMRKKGREGELPPWWEYPIQLMKFFPLVDEDDEEMADWEDWRLVIGETEYKPLFESIEDWALHFATRSRTRKRQIYGEDNGEN